MNIFSKLWSLATGLGHRDRTRERHSPGWSCDPFSHRAIAAMSLRELADLPLRPCGKTALRCCCT